MQTNNELREALKSCVDEMCDRCRELAAARGNPLPCLNGCEPVRKAKAALRKAKAALAAPRRNCDVGTAEEQTRRMEAEYCYVQKSCYESPSGRECPLHKAEVDCRLIWAQMPYKEGGAK